MLAYRASPFVFHDKHSTCSCLEFLSVFLPSPPPSLPPFLAPLPSHPFQFLPGCFAVCYCIVCCLPVLDTVSNEKTSFFLVLIFISANLAIIYEIHIKQHYTTTLLSMLWHHWQAWLFWSILFQRDLLSRDMYFVLSLGQMR